MPLAILNSYTILTVALVQVLLCFGLGLAIWRFRRPTVLNASLLAETLEINMTWGPAKWTRKLMYSICETSGIPAMFREGT